MKNWFFTIHVNDKINNINQSLSVPVSSAEFAIIRSLINYSVPKLLGFDEALANPTLYHGIPVCSD
jgi:hypothetical protein